MRNLINIFLFSFILFFPHISIAADYLWHASNSIGSTPAAACSAAAQESYSYTGRLRKVPVSPWANDGFVCDYLRADGSAASTNVEVRRTGDTCPSGSIYNSDTGACDAPEPDKCKDSTGFISHQHQVGNLDGSGSRSDPPGSICEGSCQYAFSGEAASSCYRFADGTNANGAFCKYKYKGNGISCTNGPTTPPGSLFDQPPTKPPVPLDPTLTKDIQCSDWVTNADGTGSRTCNNVSEYKDPGKIDCAQGGGALVCHPDKPNPAYTKTDITETTTTKTNPDGSKDNTTTKTTDKTTCYGAKPCTSTTATEVKTDGANADGTAKDDSKGSTCTGSGCKDLGKDSSKDDPSKDPEEHEEEPRVATGGGSCDAAPSCSGDAIDCAVLAEQHKARCDTEEARDFPKHKAEIEGLLTGAKFQQTADEEITAESFVNSGARFLPATCPVDSSFSLSFAGGHTFALSYSPFCFFAESLAPLIVIAATVFAALYVGRAFGGE